MWDRATNTGSFGIVSENCKEQGTGQHLYHDPSVVQAYRFALSLPSRKQIHEELCDASQMSLKENTLDAEVKST